MFKTKLMLAIAAVGVSASASAALDGNPGNGEFVFSAYDSAAGVGYTFDLVDSGFASVFVQGTDANSGIRMNNFIGTTNGSTLPVSLPADRILFDAALPSFGDFLSAGSYAAVQWSLASIDTSGNTRVIHTVAAGASYDASPYTNAGVKSITDVPFFYFGAVNSKGTMGSEADGYAITTPADATAYAGNTGNNFNNTAVKITGGLDDVLDLYVAGQISRTTANLDNPSFFGALESADGLKITSKVYMADDGMYHLQISAVPEPSTYAMLLAGLGLLGFAARRARV